MVFVSAVSCAFIFFFCNDAATTEIYTLHIVGSVRCVQETVSTQSTWGAILAPIKLEDDNVRVSPTIQSNKQAYDLNKGRGRPQSPKRLASLCNKENIPANHNNNNGNCNYNNIPSGKVQNKAFQNVQTPSSVLQSKDKNSQPVKAIFYDQNQNQNFNKIKITSSRRMKSSDNRKTNNNNNNNNVSIFKNHQGDPQSIKNQLR
eukprot:TRINITY_DN6111_c0_g1_i2.p1 TRINITY_DN6111_c0_g1~~TRINITY_DN6111_c0_g1_i2.p1  ORF type:complete len:203 (+),score=60.06 TRINITY_DN6111_c0_g1_i2:7-615(+)